MKWIKRVVGIAWLIGAMSLGSQAYAGTGAMTLVGEGSQITFPESSSFVVGGGKVNMGTVRLTSGIGTVTTTAVTAVSRIFLASEQMGGAGATTTMGFLFIATRTAATQFVIQSSVAQDSSLVAWLLFEPAS